MYSTGSTTKNTFRNGPEVHKLHLEFTPAAGEVIHKGQPVVLEEDGTISGAVAASEEEDIIGVSIHEGSSAYGDTVVIAMRAYTVIEAVNGKVGVDAETTIAEMLAGPVAYLGYVLASDPALASNPIASGRRENNTVETQGTNAFITASGATVIGWALGVAAAATTAAQAVGVIYGGNSVLVAIKD